MNPADAIIRAATTDDLPVMSRLIQRAIRERNSTEYSPEEIEISCAKFSEEGLLTRLNTRDVFVALYEGQIIGTVSFSGEKLYSLFILPDFDRMRLGSRLVGYIEHHALARGVVELRLSAALTAPGFYEKLGFRNFGREERPEGATYLMVKTLRAGPA